MADTTHDEVTKARAALTAPATVHDPEVLGAVHVGLLSVPTESGGRTATPGTGLPAVRVRTAGPDEAPGLAVRRRTGY